MKNLLRKLTFTLGAIGSLFNIATAETLSGKVIDAVTEQPIENISVHSGDRATYTDEQGDYEIETNQGIQRFRVSDNLTNYFNYDEQIDLTTDTLKNVWMIPIREVNVTQYAREHNLYSDFLSKFKLYTDSRAIDYNELIYQWTPLPIPVYYNEEQAFQVFEEVCARYPDHCPDEGADFLAQQYFEACDLALQDWEQKSGVDLFQRVYENTEYGIKIDYSDNDSYVNGPVYIGEDPYFYLTFAKLNINNERYLLSNPDRLRREYIHELGHCLRFGHNIADKNDIMYPGVDASTISQNEADIVKIMYTLPNWTDMRNYNNTQTRNAIQDWNLYE